jgi:hypothetical protein
MSFDCTVVPSSCVREWMSFFLCLPFVTLWKYLVFAYASNMNWALDRWYHLSSSSQPANFAFDWPLSSISCVVNGLTFAIASKLSLVDDRPRFSFLATQSCVSPIHPGIYAWHIVYYSIFGWDSDQQRASTPSSFTLSLQNHPSAAIQVKTWTNVYSVIYAIQWRLK